MIISITHDYKNKEHSRNPSTSIQTWKEEQARTKLRSRGRQKNS